MEAQFCVIETSYWTAQTTALTVTMFLMKVRSSGLVYPDQPWLVHPALN